MIYAKISKRVSLIIVFIFAIWLIWYLSCHIENFQPITKVSIDDIVMLAVLYFFTLVFNGLYTKSILHSFHVNLKPQEWFGISVITTMGNFIMPFRGGAGIRAIYLKAYHHFPISYFLSTLASVYVFYLLIYSALGIASMLCLFSFHGSAKSIILLILSFICLLSVGFIACTPQISKNVKFPLNKVAEVINGWHRVRKHKPLVAKLAFTTLILAIFGAIRIYIGFNAIGVNISIASAILITSMLELSSLINLTPGSLGIHEAITICLGSILYYTTADALLLQAILRGIFMLEVFILGPILMHYLVYKEKC